MAEIDSEAVAARIAAHELLIRDLLLIVLAKGGDPRHLVEFRETLGGSAKGVTIPELGGVLSDHLAQTVEEFATASVDGAIELLERLRSSAGLPPSPR